MKGPARKNERAKSSVDFDSLFEAFTALKTAREARRFLGDLATPAEIEAFAERWTIARTLDQGVSSYREIAAETGASTTTIGRVARFLNKEPHQGYRLMIDRIKYGQSSKGRAR